MSGLVPSTMMAQDKVEASVGADLVSGYIWRGQNLGGVSVQPSLGISYKGLSLGAWGSVGIESKDTKEFDLTLGYSIGGFSVSITDYWFDKTYTGDVDEYGKEFIQPISISNMGPILQHMYLKHKWDMISVR